MPGRRANHTARSSPLIRKYFRRSSTLRTFSGSSYSCPRWVEQKHNRTADFRVDSRCLRHLSSLSGYFSCHLPTSYVTGRPLGHTRPPLFRQPFPPTTSTSSKVGEDTTAIMTSVPEDYQNQVSDLLCLFRVFFRVSFTDTLPVCRSFMTALLPTGSSRRRCRSSLEFLRGAAGSGVRVAVVDTPVKQTDPFKKAGLVYRVRCLCFRCCPGARESNVGARVAAPANGGSDVISCQPWKCFSFPIVPDDQVTKGYTHDV